MQESSSMTNSGSGKNLGKNVLWNLVGALAPLIAAAFAVPFIIHQLGIERFGLLTLIWALIGYFSLFDMGLGQALTKRVAEGLVGDSSDKLALSIWTALGLMVLLGVVAGFFVVLIAPWLINDLLKVPEYLKDETLTAFIIMAVSLPVIVTTAGLRGVLEACQQFRCINLIRIPLGIFVFLSPLVVLPFSKSLIPLALILVIGRVLAWLIYIWRVLVTLPQLKKVIRGSLSEVRPLLSFGGWMTVSNLALPLMVYFDRFVIGALMSLAAVAFYVTPHEVVTRIRIIPIALMGVAFPAFAQSLIHSRQKVCNIFSQSQTALFLLVLPPVLIMTLFAREGLELWLDERFVENSLLVVQWLAAGVFVNAVGAIPVSLVRALGRPDLTAKLHLAELMVFFFILLELVKLYGINGAAFGYFLRWIVDTIVMLFFTVRLLPEARASCFRTFALLCLGLLILIGAVYLEGTVIKCLYVSIILSGMLMAFRHSLMQWKAQIF